MLSFPDGHFYIGSTTNLRQRISGYKSSFKNSIGGVNQLIAKKAEEFNLVYIEIIDIVPESVNPRDVEDVWIKKASDNHKFLNRSNSAYNNSWMTKKKLNAITRRPNP